MSTRSVLSTSHRCRSRAESAVGQDRCGRTPTTSPANAARAMDGTLRWRDAAAITTRSTSRRAISSRHIAEVEIPPSLVHLNVRLPREPFVVSSLDGGSGIAHDSGMSTTARRASWLKYARRVRAEAYAARTPEEWEALAEGRRERSRKAAATVNADPRKAILKAARCALARYRAEGY